MKVFFLEFKGASDIIIDDISVSIEDNNNIFINCKSVVSKYNPLEESKRLALAIDKEDCSAFLHVSLINLYLPFFLSKNSIIFEWNRKLYDVFKEYCYNKNVELIETIEIDTEEDIRNFFKKNIYENTIVYCFNPSFNSINAILFHYPGLRFYIFSSNKIVGESEKLQKTKNLIIASVNKKKINSNTAARFGKDWVKNFYANLPDYAVNKGVICYQDIMAGEGIALVVGAGYSLNQDIPAIKKNRKKLIVICVDTSLKILSDNDITPDFIVSADSQSINSLYISHGFKNKNILNKTVLVTMPTNNKLTFKHFKGRIAFSSVFFPLIKKIDAITFSKIELGAGGTVASMAYDFAQFISPKYIVLSGVDFNYFQNCLHAKSTLFDLLLLYKATYISTYEHNVIKAQLKSISFLVSTKGKKIVRSDSKFMVFKDWFVGAIKKSSIPTYFMNDTIVDDDGFNLITDIVSRYLSDSNENKIQKIIKKIQSIDTQYNANEVKKCSVNETLSFFLQTLYTQILSTEQFIRRANYITYNWYIVKNKPIVSDFRFLNAIDEKFLSFKELNDILSIYNQKHIQQYQYQKNTTDENEIIKNQYIFYSGLYNDIVKLKKIIKKCLD